MPRVSSVGLVNRVVPIFRNAAARAELGQPNVFTFSPEDSIASIQADVSDPVQFPNVNAMPPTALTVPLPAGSVIQLPGPTTTPLALPSNGDFYAVSDPKKRTILNPANVTLNGGGYPIIVEGLILTGSVLDDLWGEGTTAIFTFDGAGEVWMFTGGG